MAHETHLGRGYRIFKNKTYVEFKERYQELAKQGQNPQSMVICCSDSRVSAEAVFNAEPGDLFVVRNVAGLVPPCEKGGAYHGTSAALEFAVKHLKVENVCVMGHTNCGGIAAAVSMPEEPGDFIESWVSIIKDRRDEIIANPEHACKTEALEKAAIEESLKNMMTFDFVEKAVAASTLRLVGCLIDIATGELQTFERDEQVWEDFQ